MFSQRRKVKWYRHNARCEIKKSISNFPYLRLLHSPRETYAFGSRGDAEEAERMGINIV
jgi:hypothetical protein